MNKATNTDPIFAAIERHRAAEREFGDVLTEKGKLEKELPKELRRSNIDAHGEHIVETDDPRWIATERAVDKSSEKTVECSTALVETRPTTIQGLRALLRYVADFIGDDADVSRGILENAANALETVGWEPLAEKVSQAKDIYEPKVIDDLDEEISFALGVEAAIEGLEVDYEPPKRGILQLQRTHIERLQRLGARVLKIEWDWHRAIK
jgi:hypothetical protein